MGRYPLFIGGVTSWFLGAGMQQVLFAWLLIGELHQDPRWVGTAQMCQTLPALLFLLLGGLIADHLDRRKLLVVLHALAAVSASAMGVAVATRLLGLGLVILYGLSWGTLAAFAQPARDALLSEVVAGDLMRAVTGAALAQFAAQALGAWLAGFSGRLGNPAALGLQATVFAAGLVMAWRLPAAPPIRARSGRGTPVSAIREGWREVAHSEQLRPVAVLVACDGLFFMGPFIVLCPLIVRDVYHGGISELSLVVMALTAGTIAGSVAVLLRGGVRRKGLAFLLALLGVASCLVILGAPLPFREFIAVIVAWGVCHSLFFNTSRAIFQEAAPPTHRARVLSIHSLGLLGMAPLSNLLAGFVSDVVGPRTTCALAGLAMLAITGGALIMTSVRRVQ
jgi:MFS family permease